MPIDSKRIVKNTLFLYARMFFILLCNLYLVRVVLEALGVEDYGISNVVGGIISMMTFLTSTMNAASQRFFSFKIGEGDFHGLTKYFTLSFWGYLIVAVIILVLAESLGLWILFSKLTIPANRMSAAFWTYQGSVITFICGLFAIPYNALLIAKEKMNIYAYMGILEVMLRLAVAYSLFLFNEDRLKTYAVLLCVAMSFPSLLYIFYGFIKFKETHIHKFWDKNIFKEIFAFSGWNLFGAISSVVRSQGINILLNIFFGPTVNAARAIAYQINSAINQFVLNFFKAVQPQITKTFAAKEYSQMLNLVYRSSKLNFFLVLLIALPLFIEMPFILSIWLKNVPENTILFSRLVIITAFIESTMYPLQTALMATGEIKWYQIVTASLTLLNLPISYIILSNDFPPESVLILASVLAILSQISRLTFAKIKLNLSIRTYTTTVLIPIALVTFSSFCTTWTIYNNQTSNSFHFLLSIITATFSNLLFITIWGLDRIERKKIFSFLRRKIHAKR